MARWVWPYPSAGRAGSLTVPAPQAAGLPGTPLFEGLPVELQGRGGASQTRHYFVTPFPECVRPHPCFQGLKTNVSETQMAPCGAMPSPFPFIPLGHLWPPSCSRWKVSSPG